jgi:hypothetical protein
VVKGNQEAAEGMIKANKRLLLTTSQASNYSGRIIKGTAFQAAVGTEDDLM